MTDVLLVLKATVLVAAALLLVRVGGPRCPAALRALILTAAFVALLILPFAGLVLPPLAVTVRPGLAAAMQSLGTPAVDMGLLLERPAVETAIGDPAGGIGGVETRGKAGVSGLTALVIVRIAWLLGVLVMGVRLAVSLRNVRRLRRTAAPWPDGAAPLPYPADGRWLARTRIVIHPRIGAPVTYGILRPEIALPPDARRWPAGDLRRAVIHELEHLRRADWATQLVVNVVCALYWCHPLVWLAARRLRLAIEQACDDAVVRREDGTAYAEQLVILARRLSHGPAIGPLAMAAHGDLSQRVGAVLDSRRARHRVSAAAAGSTFVLAAGVGLVMSPLEARPAGGVSVGPMALARPLATPLGGQEGSRPPLAFEVASVRPNASPRTSGSGGGTEGGSIGPRGQRFVVRNSPLSEIIRYAYELESYQPIEGGQGLLSARFDVEALMPDLQPTSDGPREMLRTLLAERFKLSVGWTARDRIVYVLVPARPDRRLGPAIEPSTTDCTVERSARAEAISDRAMTPDEFMRYMQPVCDMTYQPFRAKIHAGARTMSDFAALLSRLPEPGGLVVDRTGLAGAYDFELNFARRGAATAAQDEAVQPADQPHPPLPVALEEQLGLRLERTRGPVTVLVVEHVEMPDPN